MLTYLELPQHIGTQSVRQFRFHGQESGLVGSEPTRRGQTFQADDILNQAEKEKDSVEVHGAGRGCCVCPYMVGKRNRGCESEPR